MKKFVALITFIFVSGAADAANTSVYTTFDLDKCSRLDQGNADEGDSGSWLCKGYGNLKIYFAEGDLRSLVAFGKSPKNHCATAQTFGGFNSANTTIEWRLKNGKPIATIQRWTVSVDPADSAKTKTFLVITKLEPNNSCHMGVVEGAFPNANTKAREVADQKSAAFTCGMNAEDVITLPGTSRDQATTSETCEKY